MKLIQKRYAVFIDNSDQEWVANLKNGIKPLLVDGVIDEQWIEKLIKSTNEMGPYFVFSELLAMPHISPDTSTKKTATGFIYFKKPLVFTGKGLKKESNIVVPLIATDGNSHMDLLAEVVTKWNDKKFIEKLKGIHDQKSFEVFVEEVENEY